MFWEIKDLKLGFLVENEDANILKNTAGGPMDDTMMKGMIGGDNRSIDQPGVSLGYLLLPVDAYRCLMYFLIKKFERLSKDWKLKEERDFRQYNLLVKGSDTRL